MDIMKKLGLVQPKILRGKMGLYFKIIDCQDTAGGEVEVYVKPAFKDMPFALPDSNVIRCTWLELNILWIGAPETPDFTGPWDIERDGTYKTEDGEYKRGFLLGKMFVPLGDFRGNPIALHQSTVDKAADIEAPLSQFLEDVGGSWYMNPTMLFQHMLENVSGEAINAEGGKVILGAKAMKTYMYKVDANQGKKFKEIQVGKPNPPEFDGESGGDNDD